MRTPKALEAADRLVGAIFWCVLEIPNSFRTYRERSDYPASWWFDCHRCGRLKRPQSPGGMPVCQRCDRAIMEDHEEDDR